MDLEIHLSAALQTNLTCLVYGWFESTFFVTPEKDIVFGSDQVCAVESGLPDLAFLRLTWLGTCLPPLLSDGFQRGSIRFIPSYDIPLKTVSQGPTHCRATLCTIMCAYMQRQKCFHSYLLLHRNMVRLIADPKKHKYALIVRTCTCML